MAVKDDAAAWFARMQGPDRAAHEAEFERWRSADPAHRAAYAEAERLWQLSAGLGATALGRSRGLPEPRPPFWQMPAARPAFATMAVLLLVAIGAWVLFVPGTQPGQVAAASEIQATRVGEIRTVRLADGSSVTLDTDTAVEVRITTDTRLVLLSRGRARFAVAPDARPFRVEAGGRSVTAGETLFDVGFEPEGVRVAVLRGAAEFRGIVSGGTVPAVTRLGSGECLTDAPRGRRIEKAPKGAAQWVSGMLDFDGVPLGDVLAQTNRYSPRKIRLGDPSLSALRVTGGFRPLPVDELAASLAAAFSLRVSRSPNGDLLLQRN